jgi:hypothetical protein
LFLRIAIVDQRSALVIEHIEENLFYVFPS